MSRLSSGPQVAKPAGPHRGPERMLSLWCPDWAVVAWGVPSDQPSVVLAANRVVAANQAARRDGVAIGLRRREAQALSRGAAARS